MKPSGVFVVVRTSFEGFHRWPDAPDEVAFLRDLHRHVFHVRAVKRVGHVDRDVEFILLKREIDGCIQCTIPARAEGVSTWSCERWAVELLERFDLEECEVSEDGENGAVVRA